MGNIRVHDWYGKDYDYIRFKCTSCGRTFTLRQGTPFFRSHIDLETAMTVLHKLGLGQTVKGTAIEMGLNRKTVGRLKRLVDEHKEPGQTDAEAVGVVVGMILEEQAKVLRARPPPDLPSQGLAKEIDENGRHILSLLQTEPQSFKRLQQATSLPKGEIEAQLRKLGEHGLILSKRKAAGESLFHTSPGGDAFLATSGRQRKSPS